MKKVETLGSAKSDNCQFSVGLVATSRVTGDVLLSLSGVYLISVRVHFALNILSNGLQFSIFIWEVR